MGGLESDRPSLDSAQLRGVEAELSTIRERAHQNFRPVKLNKNGDPKNPVRRDSNVEFGGDI